MALYPTEISTENRREETFEGISRDAQLRDFPWGKKIYWFDNGTVRAIIPIMIDVFEGKTSYYAYPTLYANVAGKGKMNIYMCSKFFETLEDYENFMKGDTSALMSFEEINLETYLRHKGYATTYKNLSSYGIRGYGVYKGSSTPSESRMSIKRMWYDADGLHINFNEGYTYLTIEEARKAIRERTAIVDFDDEDVVKETKEFSLNISISIKGETKTMASEELISAMAKIGYNIKVK